jgi:hypothetical protein
LVDCVIIDGTFWSVPREFDQLITITGRMFGSFFPLCFVLMCGKSEKNYKEVFKKVNEVGDLNLKHVIVDFEIALINSIKKSF